MTKTTLALLLLGSAALAGSIERIVPPCGAPGDLVLVCGDGFSRDPAVAFGDRKARVLRHSATKILVRVPRESEPGTVRVVVDDAAAAFTVLEKGTPVVLHVSAKTATPGLVVVLIGRRLAGGFVAFVDDDGAVAARAEFHGRRRIGWFRVPRDLDLGTYRLVVVNGLGLDSGDCSPRLEVVAPGEPTIDAVTPEEQPPGHLVRVIGTDLGPFGFCRVHWRHCDDAPLHTLGFANGYDRVYTRVPRAATPGAVHDVFVAFRDGSSTRPTGLFAYRVGRRR